MVKDLKTYPKKHPVTDIRTGYGSVTWASHPGTAWINTNPACGGRSAVSVTSGNSGITTRYRYLSRVLVTNGQVIQSGQALGNLGTKPKSKSKKYALQFSVAGATCPVNASGCLNAMVGKAPPVSGLFNMKGITLASFNLLDASHPAWLPSPPGVASTFSLFNSRAIDIVGTQEFPERQFDHWTAQGYGNTFGAYY
ncbi:hypothetical protein QBC39DRAFT_396372 [Podospora conica]|nr:hypothetical protein QBC39DRAFT_396372 [Schizothecium conicum]